MIKKNKIILSVASIITTISIVPVVAVACGTTNTADDNKTKVEKNITELKNLKLIANDNAPGTIEQATALLPKDSQNLSMLDKFFNIKTLESVATQNGVQATYSIVPSAKSAVNSTNSNTLTISIQLSLGEGADAVTETQNVYITNFPNTDQVVINNYINQLNALTGELVITGKTSISVADLTNENINVNLNNVPVIPTIPSGIVLSYDIKSIDTKARTIVVVISAISPSTQMRSSENITISGFGSPNQILINAFVAQINALTGDKVITGDSSVLPTTLTNLNIGTHLTNVPTTPNGLTLTYAISNANDTNGSVDIVISVSAIDSTTMETTSIQVSGFLTNIKIAISKYIDQINATTTGVITGKNTILPSALTTDNIGENLNNVPPAPEGIQITYAISNSDSETGTIDIVINASAPSNTTVASNTITISGFLTTNQAAINAYITNFESNTPAIIAKNIVLPSTITSISDINIADIANTFNGIVAIPTGLTATFNITSQNDTTGTVDLSVSLNGLDAKLTTSTSLTISGFLTTNQAAINAYITNFNTASITGQSTILPSLITDPITSDNMNTFFSGIPPLPTGITIVFTLSDISNTLGSLKLTVTLSNVANSSPKTSNTILIKGFKTSQIALTELTTNLSKTYPATDKASTTPTQAYDALKVLADAGTLSIESFSTYFDITQVETPISALTSATISSILLEPVNSLNLKNGNLVFDLYLSFDNITSIANITLSGFDTTTFNSNQESNLTKLQTIATNLKAAKILTTTKTTETSQVASTAILAISNLSLDSLSPYFTIANVSDLITDDATNIVSLLPLTSENKTSGTLDFSIILALGTSPNEVSLNATFTVGGFETVPNFTLTGTLAASSVFANYWATTPPTTNLGNSKSVNSLYIPDNDGTNTFNSSATLATTGTEVPSFITNINWPTDLSSTDVESWTMTGTTAGVATYNLIFNNKLTAQLTVTGFMNTNIVTALNLIGINKTNDIATLTTPVNGPLTSSVTDVTKGISGINWNGLQQSLVGDVISYRLENSIPADGTVNFIIIFAGGVILSLPINGYLRS